MLRRVGGLAREGLAGLIFNIAGLRRKPPITREGGGASKTWTADSDTDSASGIYERLEGLLLVVALNKARVVHHGRQRGVQVVPASHQTV